MPTKTPTKKRAASKLLPCPSCTQKFDTPQKLGLHRYREHGYTNPSKKASKPRKAAAKRAVSGTNVQVLHSADERMVLMDVRGDVWIASRVS